jgi:hypothetical protein
MISAVADGRRSLEANWERQMTPIPVGWRQRLIYEMLLAHPRDN